MTEVQNSPEQVIDWAVALDNVGGDETLLLELINTFSEETPKLLKVIHLCLEQKDSVFLECSEETWAYLNKVAHREDCPAPLLHRSAHTVKGNLRIFGPTTATPFAEQLELQFKELVVHFKSIDEQLKNWSSDKPEELARKRAEKRRLVEASGIMTSPSYSATFAAVPQILAQLEQKLEQVGAAMRARGG